MILDWFAAGLSILAILWTALPLLRHDAWWIRIFEFPRIQVTALTVLVLVAYVVFAGWRGGIDVLLLCALSLCIVFQLLRVLPYTRLYPTQLKRTRDDRAARTLSVLVANVLTPNRNADGILNLVREHGPDVFLAVETDCWWESKLDALEPDYPYRLKHPLDNLYGMHLYSRLELIDPQTLFLVEDNVPSMHAQVVLRCGERVWLHCLHPAPPSPTENPSSAERDAELLVVARTVNTHQGPAVVMGDLNDVAWSATTRLFQRLSGLLDPRVGRGMYSTFHADYPLLRWPLDHVFCTQDFTVTTLARLPHIGSDHFPILARLCHTPSAQALHQDLEADSTDQQWADEKIEKVDADEASLRQVTGDGE